MVSQIYRRVCETGKRIIAEALKRPGDRVLNGRDSVREVTCKKVLTALARLGGGRAPPSAARRRVAFLSVSGVSYNQALQEIVEAREDLTINRAMRNPAARRVPLVCLTTDLPNSGRSAYIGSDQVSAGATAAWLM